MGAPPLSLLIFSENKGRPRRDTPTNQFSPGRGSAGCVYYLGALEQCHGAMPQERKFSQRAKSAGPEKAANLYMQVYLKSLAFIMIIGVLFVLAWGQTPCKPEEFYGRGVGRLERGDLEGSLADFNKALEMLPTYSAAYSARKRSVFPGQREEFIHHL